MRWWVPISWFAHGRWRNDPEDDRIFPDRRLTDQPGMIQPSLQFQLEE